MTILRLGTKPDKANLSEAVQSFILEKMKTKDGVVVPAQVVAMVDPTVDPVGFARNRPWGNGVPSLLYDSTADSSDKTKTVPAGKVWMLDSIFAQLVSTATAGNRQITVAIDDGTKVIGFTNAGAVQAAGLTRQYSFYPNAPNMSAFAGTFISNGLVCGVLKAGWRIRVYDSAAVDAAADDMTLAIRYTEYDA